MFEDMKKKPVGFNDFLPLICLDGIKDLILLIKLLLWSNTILKLRHSNIVHCTYPSFFAAKQNEQSDPCSFL